jgi:hypothetical protein
MPVRIQRNRTRGYRLPEGAIYVGRPTRWGNPYRIELGTPPIRAVALFRDYAEQRLREEPDWLEPLRGKDLVCWCHSDSDCHATVLLDLANRELPGAGSTTSFMGTA